MVLASPINGSSVLESWTPGNLGGYKFKVPLAASVGMFVIARTGNYSSFEIYSSPDVTVAGFLSLFVGGIYGLVHEYKYYPKDSRWITGYTFPDSDGFRGISMRSSTELITFNKTGVMSVWQPYFGANILHHRHGVYVCYSSV